MHIHLECTCFAPKVSFDHCIVLPATLHTVKSTVPMSCQCCNATESRNILLTFLKEWKELLRYPLKSTVTISKTKIGSGFGYVRILPASPVCDGAPSIHSLVAIQSAIFVLKYLGNQDHMRSMNMLLISAFLAAIQCL